LYVFCLFSLFFSSISSRRVRVLLYFPTCCFPKLYDCCIVSHNNIRYDMFWKERNKKINYQKCYIILSWKPRESWRVLFVSLRVSCEFLLFFPLW
jgi:hypothetical protein